jgi:hypothetical protein
MADFADLFQKEDPFGHPRCSNLPDGGVSQAVIRMLAWLPVGSSPVPRSNAAAFSNPL